MAIKLSVDVTDRLFDLLNRLIPAAIDPHQLDRIERTLEKVMAKAEEFLQVVADLKREIAETAAEFQAKLDEIKQLIAQGASDAEIRTAVEAALPELQAGVAALDALQTKPAPTPPTDPPA